MKVIGHLDLASGGLQNFRFSTQDDFPVDPMPGMAIFKDKRLLMCVSIDDLPVWVPLTQQMTMMRFKQPSATSRWEIKHNLNVSTPIVQCYDDKGAVTIPTSITLVDENSLVVLFPEPVAGTAVVMAGIESGIPSPSVAFTASYTNQDTWVVVHNLGYNPSVRVYQNNNEVQPKSIVQDSVNQVTITFGQAESGTVILY